MTYPDFPNGDGPKEEEGKPDFMELLKSAGVTPDQVKLALGPMIQEVVAASLKDLPQAVDQMVTAKMDQVAAQIVDQVKGAISGAGGGGDNGAQNGAQDGSMMSLMSNPLIMGIVQKIMGVNTAPANPLSGVVEYSKTMASLWGEVLAPMMNVYTNGRSDMLTQLTSLHKMGTAMPWEGWAAPEAPVVDNVSQAKPLPQHAKEVAGKIRLT